MCRMYTQRLRLYEDEQYRRVQNGGIMAIPDGGPLSSVGQKRGYKTMSRTTGPSYMEEIFKVSVEKGYWHYFYGSTEETLTLLKEKLEQVYPGIGIAGMYSPPFRAMSAQEDEEVVARINASGADFGLGRIGSSQAGKLDGGPSGKGKRVHGGSRRRLRLFCGEYRESPRMDAEEQSGMAV